MALQIVIQIFKMFVEFLVCKNNELVIQYN